MDPSLLSTAGNIGSLVGGVTGTLAVVGGLLGWLVALRRARATEARRWSLVVGQRLSEGHRTALSRSGNDMAVVVRAIEVLAPRGAEVANNEFLNRGRTFGRVIRPEATIHERLRYNSHGEAYTSPASLALLVRMPPRPAKSRSAFTRLRISVTAEDVSAQRRQRKIIVNSQEIAWTARKIDAQA